MSILSITIMWLCMLCLISICYVLEIFRNECRLFKENGLSDCESVSGFARNHKVGPSLDWYHWLHKGKSFSISHLSYFGRFIINWGTSIVTTKGVELLNDSILSIFVLLFCWTRPSRIKCSDLTILCGNK